MNYIYDFDLCSILFFGLTIFFYLYQRRLRNLQDSIYTAMLVSSMTAVVFDFLAAAIDRYAMLHPIWLVGAVNWIFLLAMQTCLPLFYLYAVAMAGRFSTMTTKKLALAGIPFVVTLVLLALSCFSKVGIFYIDEAHTYRYGVTYAMLYVNMSFYVVAGVVVLFKNLRNIQRVKRSVILIFVFILFCSVVIQMTLKRYLVTASATALALTSIFYVLQSPVDQINPLTGAFSRTMLPFVLQDYAERGKPYTMMMVSLRSFNELTRLYGVSVGNDLLGLYAADLMKRFADDIVVFMDTTEFVIVRGKILSRADMEALYAIAPPILAVDGITVQLNFNVGALPCPAGSDAAANFSLADYVLRQLRNEAIDAPLYADETYQNTGRAIMRLEPALDAGFQAERLALAVHPVRAADGALVLQEPRFVLPDGAQGYVTYDQFLQAVAQRGYAWEYYGALLARFAGEHDVNSAQALVCLPLLTSAFIQEDAAEHMRALVEAAGFSPSQLLFAVDECEIASALSILTENIRRFALVGFSFMVDTFAAGYTDMSLIISLPIVYARLHESLVENASASVRDKLLLQGLLTVLKDVHITAVCPGIDTGLDHKTALEAGAPLLQGAFVQ